MTEIQAARAADRIVSNVEMLKTYLDKQEMAPLTTAMAALAEAPGDAARKAQVEAVSGEPGILQGAVLTYPPRLAEMLAGDVFGDDTPHNN